MQEVEVLVTNANRADAWRGDGGKVLRNCLERLKNIRKYSSDYQSKSITDSAHLS